MADILDTIPRDDARLDDCEEAVVRYVTEQWLATGEAPRRSNIVFELKRRAGFSVDAIRRALTGPQVEPYLERRDNEQFEPRLRSLVRLRQSSWLELVDRILELARDRYAPDRMSLTNREIEAVLVSAIPARTIEAWLLADEHALSGFLERPVPALGAPEDQVDPEAELRRVFRENGRADYLKTQDAVKVARLLDPSRLERLPSWQRALGSLREAGVMGR